jgi:hypothetical protein
LELYSSAQSAPSQPLFFGWRKDRRDGRDLELRVKELEMKLRAAETAAVQTAPPAMTPASQGLD